MTTPTIATCPRCSQRDTIFVRDGDHVQGVDNLVCFKSCQEGAPQRTPIADLPSSWQLSGSRR